MKNILKLFFLLACLGFLPGCNETQQIDEELNELKLKSAHIVFTVEPNGIDDTKNLNDAFANAIATGPGTAVQLVEGTYYVNFIEVQEFVGQFKGAGKGKTVITNIETLDNSTLTTQNLNAVLLRFVGGDVCMKNMTVQYNMDYPVVWLHGLTGFSSVTATYVSNDEYINVVVNNVEFKGHPTRNPCGIRAESGFLNGPNVPLSDIDILVTNCSFDSFRNYGALIQQVKKGKIAIGTKHNGNVFNNSWAQLGIWHNVNVEILVEGNTILNPRRWGIQMSNGPYPNFLQQVPQTSQTVCNIQNNIFNVDGGFGAIWVDDHRRFFEPGDDPMLVQIRNNRFNMNEGTFVALGCMEMNGMVVRNNKFSGSSSWGLRMIGDPNVPYNENGLVLGNNFHAAFTYATVLLQEFTRNWTVVGSGKGVIVNEGENNIITGMNVNTSDTPLGQTIVDNLQEMKDAFKKADE